MLRPLFLAVFSFMLIACGTAHVRETVMLKLQENGVQRFYETEVHAHGNAAVRVASLKMGRKPIEVDPHEDAVAHAAPEGPRGRTWRSPASPRAPPHQPRAPPIA